LSSKIAKESPSAFGNKASNKENMKPHGDQSTQVLMGSGYNQKKVQNDSLMNESAIGPN
jgi:hypothetical protein